jgi:hypothetical protein
MSGDRMKKEIPTDRHIVYQRQFRTCGKARYRCYRGEKHGPYWYAYWYISRGKITSKYIGKVLPGEVDIYAGKAEGQRDSRKTQAAQ